PEVFADTLLARLMHARERQIARRDTNRLVRPFEWGAELVVAHANGDDPRELMHAHNQRALADSADYFALPEIADYQLKDNLLTWTSAVHTPAPENNTVRARFFAPHKRKAATNHPPPSATLPHGMPKPKAYSKSVPIFAP